MGEAKSSTAIGPVAQVATLKDLIKKSAAAIAEVAPKHLNPERLARLVTVAFQRNPSLAECAPVTVLGAVLQASALGLEVEDGTQRAYLVPFFNKKKGRKEAQLIIGYRGFVSLMHNTGLIKRISAGVVHQKDRFEYELGSAPFVKHVPSDDADPGVVTHAYFAVEFINGGIQTVVMNRHQIDARRRRSQQSDSGPWKNDFEAMCLKTVVREGNKLVPVTTDRMANFHQALGLDGRASAGRAQDPILTPRASEIRPHSTAAVGARGRIDHVQLKARQTHAGRRPRTSLC